MIIGGIYPIKNGLEIMRAKYPREYQEILDVIASVDIDAFPKKISQEKTMRDKLLFSPIHMNKAIKGGFQQRHWKNYRVVSEYSVEYYVDEYKGRIPIEGAFRDMDFVKNKVGVEVQFGKYAFMVYNVSAKMTIFHNLGVIDVGVEVVPLKTLAEEMSSGVSYFEQFVWDLHQRGEADIDIPVVVLGVTTQSLLKSKRPPPRQKTS